VPATQQTESSLIEAFSSIQGEGLLVGCRQIFLRLPLCNLNCQYCDTPFEPTRACQIEDPPGSGTLVEHENPVSLALLCEIFTRWCEQAPGAHHSFSITGGEPLLHTELLRVWLPELRKILPIYLETNGTLPENLENLLPMLDWISMDIKLQSVSGQQTDWEVQRRFLELSTSTHCYVKLVVGRTTSEEEIARAAMMVASVSSSIELILQPVTIAGKVGINTAELLRLQSVAAQSHLLVRVIPQTHIFLGLM